MSGVTPDNAGPRRPGAAINDSFYHMPSSIMEELLAESNFSLNVEGDIVEGIITEIRQNEVIVDIGGKSEGVVPAHEFIDLGDLQVGLPIEVLVEKVEDKGGNPVVSYDKAQQKKKKNTHRWLNK